VADPLGERKAASGGSDQQQVWAKALDIDADLAAAVADPIGRTVRELINAWLPAMKGEWASTHWDKCYDMARRFIVPTIGHLPAWPLTRAGGDRRRHRDREEREAAHVERARRHAHLGAREGVGRRAPRAVLPPAAADREVVEESPAR
jgi:hypothetical protein